MSKTLWWILGFVVVILLALGVWYWMSGGEILNAPSASNGSANTNAAAVAASLNADLNAIDVQLNGFVNDNSSIDSGLYDQPVQQSSL